MRNRKKRQNKEEETGKTGTRVPEKRRQEEVGRV